MEELREYDAVINGTETTLLLTADEAKRRGLTGKGRARSDGEHSVDELNVDTEEAQKVREDAAKQAEKEAQKAREEEAKAAQERASKARTARDKVGAAQNSPTSSPADNK